MFTRQDRAEIARYLVSQLTPQWAQNPQLREDLKTFVNTGSMDSIQDGRVSALLQELNQQSPTTDRQTHIRQLLHQHGIPMMTAYVQDESLRSGMADMMSDVLNTPEFFDPNVDSQQRQQLVQAQAMQMVQGMMGSRANSPEFQRMMVHYQQAGMPSPYDKGRFRQYLMGYFREANPHMTDAQIHMLVEQQMASIPKEERGIFSLVPDGCMLPLAFVALFGFLGLVMIILFVGVFITSPAFAETKFGSALGMTFLVMSVGTSVFLWVRRHATSPIKLVQLASTVLIFGGIIFAMFQSGVIDIEAFTEGTLEDQQRVIGSGLLILSVGSAILLWVRRQFMNIIWTIALLVIIIGAMIFAVQSGIIDLESLTSNINSTSTP